MSSLETIILLSFTEIREEPCFLVFGFVRKAPRKYWERADGWKWLCEWWKNFKGHSESCTNPSKSTGNKIFSVKSKMAAQPCREKREISEKYEKYTKIVHTKQTHIYSTILSPRKLKKSWESCWEWLLEAINLTSLISLSSHVTPKLMVKAIKNAEWDCG